MISTGMPVGISSSCTASYSKKQVAVTTSKINKDMVHFGFQGQALLNNFQWKDFPDNDDALESLVNAFQGQPNSNGRFIDDLKLNNTEPVTLRWISHPGGRFTDPDHKVEITCGRYNSGPMALSWPGMEWLDKYVAAKAHCMPYIALPTPDAQQHPDEVIPLKIHHKPRLREWIFFGDQFFPPVIPEIKMNARNYPAYYNGAEIDVHDTTKRSFITVKKAGSEPITAVVERPTKNKADKDNLEDLSLYHILFVARKVHEMVLHANHIREINDKFMLKGFNDVVADDRKIASMLEHDVLPHITTQRPLLVAKLDRLLVISYLRYDNGRGLSMIQLEPADKKRFIDAFRGIPGVEISAPYATLPDRLRMRLATLVAPN